MDNKFIPDIRMVVGLGNPGEKFANNRHNIGFRVIDRLAKAFNKSFSENQDKVIIEAGNATLILLKPQTYMNSSGEAVKALAIEYQLSPEQIIVISDDLDLPLEQLRIRKTGGSGGHNGLLSIINCLGAKTFIRIRAGIGRGEDPLKHVLSDFNPDEISKVNAMIEKASLAVLQILIFGINGTMNHVNKKDKIRA